MHWKTALCSLSAGMIVAPCRFASRMTITSDNEGLLVCRTMFLPAFTAERVGSRPAAPTTATTAVSASGRQPRIRFLPAQAGVRCCRERKRRTRVGARGKRRALKIHERFQRACPLVVLRISQVRACRSVSEARGACFADRSGSRQKDELLGFGSRFDEQQDEVTGWRPGSGCRSGRANLRSRGWFHRNPSFPPIASEQRQSSPL